MKGAHSVGHLVGTWLEDTRDRGGRFSDDYWLMLLSLLSPPVGETRSEPCVVTLSSFNVSAALTHILHFLADLFTCLLIVFSHWSVSSEKEGFCPPYA